MTTPSYITAQDLVDAMGEPTYMAIFNDANSGSRDAVDASTQVLAVLRKATTWVSSWLVAALPALPPESPAGIPTGGDAIPVLYKDACVQYGVILSYRRHPEYVKTYGAEPNGSLMKELLEFMARIQNATQRATVNDSGVTPGNVGGFAVDNAPRIITDSPDGTLNNGDF